MIVQDIQYQPTEKEIQEIKDAFDLFDVNGDRKVQIEEIKIAMRALGFEPTDQDLNILSNQCQNNFTDEKTFFNLMYKKIQETNPTLMMRQAFNLFIGENGEDHITIDDFKRVAKETQINIDDVQLTEIMLNADKDKNGIINFEEFKKVIKKTHLFQLIRF